MKRLIFQHYKKLLYICIALLCSIYMFLPTSNAQLTNKKVLEIPAINQGNYNDCVTASFYMAMQAVNPKLDESIHHIIHHIKEYDGISPKIIPSHNLLNSYIKSRTGVDAIHLSCNNYDIPSSSALTCVDRIKSFIRKNIDEGKPVVLASTGWLVSASGHAVIIIGYDGDDYYYIHNPGAGDTHPTGINQRVNIHKDFYNNKLLGDYSEYMPGVAGSSDYSINYTATVIPKSLNSDRSLLNATIENRAFGFRSPGSGKRAIDYQINRTIPELDEFVDTLGTKYDSIPWDYPILSITNLDVYKIYNASNTNKTVYLKIDIGREDDTKKLPSMVSDRGTISPYNLGSLGMGQITKNVDINKLRDPDKQVDCYYKVSFYNDNDAIFHQRKIVFKLDPGNFDFVQSKLLSCNEYEFSLFNIQTPPKFQKVVYEFENQQTGFKDNIETKNKDGIISYVFPQAGTYKIITKVITGGHNDIYQENETEITIKEETVDFNSSNEGNKYIFKSAGGCQMEDVSYNWEILDSGGKDVYTKSNDTYASHTFTESGNYTVTLKAINNKTKKINGLNSKKITVSVAEDLSSKAKKAFLDKNWAELFNLYRAAKMDSDKIIIKDYLHQLAVEFHDANTKHLQDFKDLRMHIDVSYNVFEKKYDRDYLMLEEAVKATKAGSPERASLQKQLDDLKQCERATNQRYQTDISNTSTAIHILEKLAGYDYTTTTKWLTAGPGIVLSDGHIAFFKKNDVKQLDIAYDLTKPIPKPDYNSYCSNSRILEIPPVPFVKIRASKTNARAGEIVELKAVLIHPPDGKGGRIVAAPDPEYDDTEIIIWTGPNIITTHGLSNRYESSRSFMATETGEYVIKVTADGYKPATITISVGGARTSGEILGLDKNREFFGSTKEITYVAKTSSGDAQFTGINYSQSIRWDSSPGLSFNPQETKGGGEEGIKTRVTFTRMLNPIKLWAEIFWQHKDNESRVKSPVREVEVVSPDFSLSFNPPQIEAKVGEPLIVKVESQPQIPNNLIEYRWVEPTDRKELDNGVIEIIPKNNKPIDFHVIARVPGFGDVVNDNIKGQYTPGAHKVVASLVGPKYDKDSQEWSETQNGLLTKKTPLVTGQEIVATVVVEDFDNEKVTVRWESNDGCSIHHGQYSRNVTVYRNEPGDCILKVTAYDKDKNVLGTDDLTINISEQNTNTTKTSDNYEEQVTIKPDVDLDSQKEQAQQQARQQAAQEAISEAQVEASKGKFYEAITAAEKAAALDPENVDIKEQIRAIKDRKEKTLKVIEEVKASLTQNNIEMAETLLKQLEKEFPDSSITHNLNTELVSTKKNFVNKALTDSKAYIKTGKIEVAIRNLEKAASLDPYDKEVSTLLVQLKDSLQKINTLYNQYKQAISNSDYKTADKTLKEMQAINRYHPDVVAAQSALFSEGQQKRSDLNNKLYAVDKLISQGEIDQAITLLESIITESESINEGANIRTEAQTKLEYLLNKKNIADQNLKEAEKLINAGIRYYNDANRTIDNALMALPAYKPSIAMKERMNAIFTQQQEGLNKQNELSQEAFKYLNNCDYNKAAEVIEQAKAINPDNIAIAKNAFDINTKRKAFLESLNRARLYIVKGDTSLAKMELDRHDKICIANSDYKSVQESFDKYKLAVKKEVEGLLNLITDAIKKKDIAVARMNLNKIKARKDLPEGSETVLQNFEKLLDDLEKQLNFVATRDNFTKQPVPVIQSLPLSGVDYIKSKQAENKQQEDVKVFDKFISKQKNNQDTFQSNRNNNKTSLSQEEYPHNIESYDTKVSGSAKIKTTMPSTSTGQSLISRNYQGRWDMLVNINYKFNLDLTQKSNRIEGTMTRTNGTEPIDKVQGEVLPDGSIKFTRFRQNSWKQHYVGKILITGGKISITGTFNQNGRGNYTWHAKKLITGSSSSSAVRPTQTTQVVSPSVNSQIKPKTVHIVFKNHSNSPVHFYGMGQKASSANKVMPGKQVSSSIRMAIPETRYYANQTGMPKKTVKLLLNTLKQGETITLIYGANGHFYVTVK